MSTSASGGELEPRRIDRILAFMSLGLVVLSIVCFFATMLMTGMHITPWPLVVVMPLVALPIAFLLIVALLIMTFVRRARASKQA